MPNLYTDEGAAPAQAAPPTAEPPEQKEDSGEPVATLPKAVLGGKDFKPGEEVMLKIVKVMEDSVIVAYASEEGGHEEYGESEPESEPETRGGMGKASILD